MADAAAARRAKRRKERVLRGGKDRLAYITGEKKELAKDAKPLTQDSNIHDDALRTSPDLKNQHQHHEKPKQRGQGQIGNGAGDLPRILPSAPPIHNSSARTRTTTRHLGSTAATAKGTGRVKEESFNRRWARRVLPLVLGVTYWAYVSNDFGGAGENVDDGDVRRRTGFYANAVAWFLTYQVSANESERNRQSG